MKRVLTGLCLIASLNALDIRALCGVGAIEEQASALAFARIEPDLNQPGKQLNSNSLQPAKAIQKNLVPQVPKGKPSRQAHRIMNINFGMAPKNSKPQGVIGGPNDIWTLVDVKETKKAALPMADGTITDVIMNLSENDGEWGIPGSFDIYHAYLYHNCRCVDLSVTLKYLRPGTYEVYVFAHGDAPDQNALIKIQSAGKTYTGKKTLNDGSHRYRSRKHEEGNQYVKYNIEVKSGIPVIITSKRDGSTLSMFNAIQLKSLKVK